MKYTIIPQNIQNRLREILSVYPRLTEIIEALNQADGKVLLVGGAVRDLLLEIAIKDLDIEIHGLDIKKVEETLSRFGFVDSVGKAFGVLRVHPLNIDWSIPRVDTAGRKPEVTIDPFMGIAQAFMRRDLTMNAMGIDLVTYELHDPFGGLDDMQQKILRTPNPAFFVEDPLRFFRVMQFCARFEMQPDDELNGLCASMDISGVSRERIESEYEKWLLKSKKPSLALDWLHLIGRLKDIMPEVAACQGIQQSLQWHPEGDVYEHTKQTIDAAASFEYTDTSEKLNIVYASLCHDFGKVTKTQITDGKITSYGHAQESAKLARKFLRRITHKKELLIAVTKLVRYHMEPIQLLRGNAKLSAYKRLAKKLAPEVTLRMLSKVFLADKLGRNPQKGFPLSGTSCQVDAFLRKAEKAQVAEKVEQPVLLGRDLLDVISPGKELGMLLKQAYEIQIEEGIVDKVELKKRVLKK